MRNERKHRAESLCERGTCSPVCPPASSTGLMHQNTFLLKDSRCLFTLYTYIKQPRHFATKATIRTCHVTMCRQKYPHRSSFESNVFSHYQCLDVTHSGLTYPPILFVGSIRTQGTTERGRWTEKRSLESHPGHGTKKGSMPALYYWPFTTC